MTESTPQHSMAVAMQWVARIMSAGLMMVLPGLAGFWLDGKLGTEVLFMLIGFALGGFAAVMQLISLTKKSNQGHAKSAASADEVLPENVEGKQ